jgi:hypothetical protein
VSGFHLAVPGADTDQRGSPCVPQCHACRSAMERAAGIAPATPAWKAGMYLSTLRPHGVADRKRSGDLGLGKPALCQLSYSHKNCPGGCREHARQQTPARSNAQQRFSVVATHLGDGGPCWSLTSLTCFADTYLDARPTVLGGRRRIRTLEHYLAVLVFETSCRPNGGVFHARQYWDPSEIDASLSAARAAGTTNIVCAHDDPQTKRGVLPLHQ